jgi:small-conductance mechanosensitive channel
MKDLLEQSFWGNTYFAYLVAFGSMLLTWAAVQVIKRTIGRRIHRIVVGTESEYDDMVFRAVQRFLLPLAYIAINYQIITQLNLHPNLVKVLRAAMYVVAVYFIVRAVNHMLEALLKGIMEKRQESAERIRQLKGVMLVLKAVIWLLGLVVLLDNLGYDVATIIAGMGIGGIAIALAAQTILGDLFSYFVIFFDKPFEIGDFILVEDKLGSIEHIGIKTTRIRSLSGEQIILSNNHLTNSAVHNFKRMARRRISFTIRVSYATPAELIKEIPVMIKEIIDGVENASFDRSHMASFGEYSIHFDTVYYIESPDYLKYMDAQQQILQRIFEAFQAKGIEFAIPTQHLFLAQRNGPLNGSDNK